MTSSTVHSRSGSRVGRRRVGAARIGVLLAVLPVMAGTYVAVTSGGIYVDYRKFRDQMVVHGRLAQTMDDQKILQALQSSAERLDLPAGATANIRIQRAVAVREIHIESEYEEIIELPFYRWAVKLRPSVRVSF